MSLSLSLCLLCARALAAGDEREATAAASTVGDDDEDDDEEVEKEEDDDDDDVDVERHHPAAAANSLEPQHFLQLDSWRPHQPSPKGTSVSGHRVAPQRGWHRTSQRDAIAQRFSFLLTCSSRCSGCRSRRFRQWRHVWRGDCKRRGDDTDGAHVGGVHLQVEPQGGRHRVRFW